MDLPLYLEKLSQKVCSVIRGGKTEVLQAQFGPMFESAKGADQRKLLELSILLNWPHQVQFCLDQGVSPNGYCILDKLSETKVQAIALNNSMYGNFINKHLKEIGTQIRWTPTVLALYLHHHDVALALFEKASLKEGALLIDPHHQKKTRRWPPLYELLNTSIRASSIAPERLSLLKILLSKEPTVEHLDKTRPFFPIIVSITQGHAEALKCMEPYIRDWDALDKEKESRIDYFLNNISDYYASNTNPQSEAWQARKEIFKILLRHCTIHENHLKRIHAVPALMEFKVQIEKEALLEQLPESAHQKDTVKQRL